MSWSKPVDGMMVNVFIQANNRSFCCCEVGNYLGAFVAGSAYYTILVHVDAAYFYFSTIPVKGIGSNNGRTALAALRQSGRHYIITAKRIIKSSCINSFFCRVTKISGFKKS